MSNPGCAVKSPEHIHLNKMAHGASSAALTMLACQSSCQRTMSTPGLELSLLERYLSPHFPHFSVCDP